MKNYVKENKVYIIFFICFFLISLLFPYSGDDWVWGTYSFDLNTISKLSYDLELNGRYIGNLFAILLTRNTIVRGIIMSLTLTLLLQIINKFTKGKKYLDIILLFIIPACIFKQVIPWSAGFANYMISILILFNILDILINNKEKHISLIFLLCFAGSLFLENITIFILLLTLFMNVKYYIKNKKVNKLYLVAFLGSLLGTFIMFIHPSYIRNLNGGNYVRYVGKRKNIIIYNYFYNFTLYGINANYLIFALLEILLFVYSFINDHLDGKNMGLFGISYLMLLYILLTESIPSLYEKVYLNGVISTLYLIFLLLILYRLFGKNNNYYYIWYILLICIIITGPLLIVSAIGPRNFFIVSLLVGMLTIRLYNDLFRESKIINKIVLCCIILFTIYYVFVFMSIHKVYIEREKYIYDNRCMNTIYVPRLPHRKYVWWVDFDDNLGDYFPNYYKKYRNLDSRIKFVFEDYDSWLDHKNNISTCS